MKSNRQPIAGGHGSAPSAVPWWGARGPVGIAGASPPSADWHRGATDPAWHIPGHLPRPTTLRAAWAGLPSLPPGSGSGAAEEVSATRNRHQALGIQPQPQNTVTRHTGVHEGVRIAGPALPGWPTPRCYFGITRSLIDEPAVPGHQPVISTARGLRAHGRAARKGGENCNLFTVMRVVIPLPIPLVLRKHLCLIPGLVRYAKYLALRVS